MIRQNQVNEDSPCRCCKASIRFLDRHVHFPGIAASMQLAGNAKNRYNQEVQVYELTGGVELVPLLTSRRYYSQPQSIRYITTDATSPGYTTESYVLHGNEIYLPFSVCFYASFSCTIATLRCIQQFHCFPLYCTVQYFSTAGCLVVWVLY